ncbi:MAG: protoporphyrinogen/coproporphyrinogen oxidase [Lacisediminihabitans sp.]
MADQSLAGGSVAASAIVVGGGIAGLVAARELAIGGLRVTLLEAAPVLGGKVACHTVAGIELDAGAESFATRRGTVAALAAELGLDTAIVAPNPAGAWLQRPSGEALPLPKSGLFGIPGTPLAADVIAVIGLRGALRAQLDALMLGFVAAGEPNLGTLVRRRMGRKVLDQLVAPVVMGVHSRHPDELEVDAVAPGLRTALLGTGSLSHAVLKLRAAAPAGSAVSGIEGGLFRLVEVLEQKLSRLGVEVRTSSPVSAVEAGRVTLGGGDVLEADHVILAARLAAQPGASTETAIVLATLVVEVPALDAAPRGTGLLIAPGVPGIRAKALTHATAKWAWLAKRAGAGRHVLRLSYDRLPSEELRDDELQEQARADAEKLLGVPIPAASVLGFARTEWLRPPSRQTVPEGVTVIGESASGTGLATVIAHARSEVVNLLRDPEG